MSTPSSVHAANALTAMKSPVGLMACSITLVNTLASFLRNLIKFGLCCIDLGVHSSSIGGTIIR